MTNVGDVSRAPSAAPPRTWEREIGRVVGPAPGPTLVVVGAIHGNERAGVEAARQVFDELARKGDLALAAGELVAFVGNVGAAREGKRYRARDLNRVWLPSRVAELRARPRAELDAEDAEQMDLLDAIASAIARARGPVYLVDLHTTSAHGIPFVIFGDTDAQRAFVRELPIPLIFGLEEQLDGVLSEYATRLGCITFAIEGGQHDDPASVENLRAVVLLAAASAGILAETARGAVRDAHALLDRRRQGLPRVLEVLSRHAITEADAFVMEPGFRNIDRAHAGQTLGRDRRGPIRAPHDGVVLLPLYQGQGADGFFWGRELGPARLFALETVRRLGLDRLLDRLPGIERDPEEPARLVVTAPAADLYPRSVYRWLGYRRIRESGATMTIERHAEGWSSCNP